MENINASEKKDEMMESGVLEEETAAEEMSLEDFLSDNPVSFLTEEIVLSERLKNFKFKIGSMTGDEREKYLQLCLIKDKKGRILKQNLTKFNELVVVNHCLYPNFNDLGFIRKCGCSTPSEALYKVLKIGEIERLSQKIMELNGFEDFEELRSKAKN